jgi:NADPH-dependent glutamate synthase beta subunit-like oxidoreductase/Pyruvate/2-oxoacid:ferredoxin oxidoreductase delta subunit
MAPYSQRTTEGFKTGLWSPHKPEYVEKISPCRLGCPIGTDMARAFAEASKGNLNQALRIVRQDNPLPGICGRVCYHPCEGMCNRQFLDEAVNIRGFERYLSDHGQVDLTKEIPEKVHSERVAVIGSGPAGLSAAYHLVRLGYGTTVFEALPEPGGMLRFGIPEYRLPQKVLQREIDLIRHSGVEIKTGIRVGIDYSFKQIMSQFQALFLAAGAHIGHKLGLEGEDSPGLWGGIDFLRRINLGEKVKVGRRVVVVGGGNTAIDCARAARRLGGKQVTILYRRSLAEMPALAEDRALAAGEGIEIKILSAPKRLILEKGRISGLECLRMELGPMDGQGRPVPLPLEGSEFTLAGETVIIAVGQFAETEFVKELDLTVDSGGRIQVDLKKASTSIPGVFAGGDWAGNRAFVADAVAGGKLGALAVSCFLQGKDLEEEFRRRRIGSGSSFSFHSPEDEAHSPVDLQKTAAFDRMNTLTFPHRTRRNNPSDLRVEEGRKSFKEGTSGLTKTEMDSEIARCFKCGTCIHCDLCFLICPDLAIVKAKGAGYELQRDFCKGCGMCASTCPRQVIELGDGR